jgi:hypothetical protein
MTKLFAAKEPSVPPSSADIAARIAAQRERLETEKARELQLMEDRLEPLESGDDVAVDRIEAEINTCREAQFRIAERIDILERRAVDAHLAEKSAAMDALAVRAADAAKVGERLILTEYRRHGRALANVLRKLWAIDRFIDQCNQTLRAGDRESVRTSNSVRCRPLTTSSRIVRKRVGINESEHPYHGRAIRSPNTDQCYVQETGETVDAFMEIEVEETATTGPDHQEPLWKAIKLPRVEASPAADLWVADGPCEGRSREGDTTGDLHDRIAAQLIETLVELGLEPASLDQADGERV